MTEKVIRGVPMWLLAEYVREMGGQEGEADWLVGAGWQMRLSPAEDYVIGSLRIGQVRLEIAGEADSAARAWEALQPRLLRGGG